MAIKIKATATVVKMMVEVSTRRDQEEVAVDNIIKTRRMIVEMLEACKCKPRTVESIAFDK